MIVCLATGNIYLGQSFNLAKRFKYTRKSLYNGHYSSKKLLEDKETFGIESFYFVPLYYGSKWKNLAFRQEA